MTKPEVLRKLDAYVQGLVTSSSVPLEAFRASTDQQAAVAALIRALQKERISAAPLSLPTGAVPFV